MLIIKYHIKNNLVCGVNLTEDKVHCLWYEYFIHSSDSGNVPDKINSSGFPDKDTPLSVS